MNLIDSSLVELRTKIEDEHKAVELSAASAVEHAMSAGNLLLKAKAICPHGLWEKWLADNFSGAARTARTYMLLARRLPHQRVANLSLREALTLVYHPDEPDKPEVVARQVEAAKAERDHCFDEPIPPKKPATKEPVIVVSRPVMHRSTPREGPMTRPLLRGVLFSLLAWEGHPERPGWERRNAQIAVWCPYCGQEHVHSWDLRDDGRHAAHRVAHCTSRDSHFREDGYFISPLRRKDQGYNAHITTPGEEIVRRVNKKKLEPVA
jgi:hypothetical protein